VLFPVTDTITQKYLIGKVDNFFQLYFEIAGVLFPVTDTITQKYLLGKIDKIFYFLIILKSIEQIN